MRTADRRPWHPTPDDPYPPEPACSVPGCGAAESDHVGPRKECPPCR